MSKGNRVNTYFRQTAKAFRAARQTQIFSHIKRNVYLKITKITRSQFNRNLQKINSFSKLKSFKIPKQFKGKDKLDKNSSLHK